jgi:hypothetical protein
MQLEEFCRFDFWKDSEPLPHREENNVRLRPLSKTVCVKDYPSTNPSQASKQSVAQSQIKSNKSVDT